jgi:hypothetical protein
MNDSDVKRLVLQSKLQEAAAQQREQQVGMVINLTQGMLNAVCPPEVVADVCVHILANMAVTSGVPSSELTRMVAKAHDDYSEKQRKLKLTAVKGELNPTLKTH